MPLPRCLVVGAGPAGAALAYLLARRGLEVTLVERQRDFAREFRGEAVMPSGADAFRQMGLGADFDALPQARPRRIWLYRNARPVLRLDADEVGGDFELPRLISQPAMLEMLVARAAAFPGFRLLRGETASELVQEGDRVCGVRLRGHDEPLRADLVVGADGRASQVQRKAGLSHEIDPERFDVVWVKVPLPGFVDDPTHTVLAFIGRGHLLLAFPAHDDRLQLGWVIEKGGIGHLREEGIDAWLAEMARHVGPELGAHLRASKDELSHPFVLDVVCHILPRWTAPGVLLLGDAAHPMSPVGGQGINIALRDALVAANHLVPALEAGAGPAALDAAAAAVEAERRPEAERIQRLQRVPPRFLFQRTWWARAALALLPVLAGIAARVGGRPPIAGEFAFGVTDVELRV